MILNQFPGWLGLELTTPFEIVHNSKADSKTWFELFSIGYFNHETYNAESRSKLQARTLDGIVVGRYDRSNSIIFYYPITSSYYRPPYFRLDESRLPIINFPNSLHFDGGLTCSLIRNNTNPICEPFPPGTRVSIQHDDALAHGTIKNIPIPVSQILKCVASPYTEHSDKYSISSDIQESPPHVILLDSGTTVKKSYDDLIQDSQDDTSPFQVTKQCRRHRGRSTLPLSWFQIHDGPQGIIPQEVHQLIPWKWIPVHSKKECKFYKGRF